jgi:hypothetical protein
MGLPMCLPASFTCHFGGDVQQLIVSGNIIFTITLQIISLYHHHNIQISLYGTKLEM